MDLQLKDLVQEKAMTAIEADTMGTDVITDMVADGHPTGEIIGATEEMIQDIVRVGDIHMTAIDTIAMTITAGVSVQKHEILKEIRGRAKLMISCHVSPEALIASPKPEILFIQISRLIPPGHRL